MKTHQDFLKSVEEKNIKGIDILGTYKRWDIPIELRCQKDGYEWAATPNAILRGRGCPLCANKVVVCGANDLASVRPDLVKYFANKHDAEKYTQFSNKKAMMKCPDCGYEHKMVVQNLSNRHFSCPCCSDGISYPNKFGRAVMMQLEVDRFEFEYQPDWLAPYFFDMFFELDGKAYAVEMDGLLGHGNMKFRSTEKDTVGIERDRMKDGLASQNNVTVIRIDCKKSETDYIKNSIENSELSRLFDLSSIDWLACASISSKSVIRTVCDVYNSIDVKTVDAVVENTGYGRSTVVRYLTKGGQLGWCDYDPYKVKEEMYRKASHPVEVYDPSSGVTDFYYSTGECSRCLTDKFGIRYCKTGITRSAKSNKTYKGLYFRYATGVV